MTNSNIETLSSAISAENAYKVQARDLRIKVIDAKESLKALRYRLLADRRKPGLEKELDNIEAALNAARELGINVEYVLQWDNEV
jgi:hypothetical protein